MILEEQDLEFAEKNELLTFAIENDMLNLAEIQNIMQRKRKEQYLSQHNHVIWQGKNGKWNTYIDDDTGKRLLRTRNTRVQIEDLIVDHLKNREENPTVHEVFTAWSDRKLSLNRICKSTYDRYRVEFNKYFRKLRRRKIKTFTEIELIEWLEEQIPEYNMTSKQFGNLKTIVRGIFKYAKRKGYTNINIETVISNMDVTELCFRRTMHEDIEEVYDEDETEKMFCYLREHKDQINLCIMLMFITGMRVGEAVVIRHCDICDGFITVRHTQTRYMENGKYVRDIKDFPKSLAGWRTIVIPESYLWVLDEVGRLNPESEFVFCGNDGQWISPQTINTRIRSINEKLGIYHKSAHKIRKTYGSILLDSGIDKQLIIQQMGHSDILTTENHYHRNRRSIDRKRQVLSSIPEFM